jgi:hypothetical protein
MSYARLHIRRIERSGQGLAWLRPNESQPVTKIPGLWEDEVEVDFRLESSPVEESFVGDQTAEDVEVNESQKVIR